MFFRNKHYKRSLYYLKSTITSVGSINAIVSGGKHTILQSIGQSGIIGTSEFNNTIVQQGFLTNTRFFTINNSNTIDFEETLSVVISPNPFIDYIKINFSSKTKHPIHLRIFDINRRLITQKTYQPSESIIVPMKNFSVASYIAHIVSGRNKYVKKILKKD